MLQEGQIPHSEAEGEAVAALEAAHPGKPLVGVTRRDPGETGPLLVTLGDETFEVNVG